MEKPIFLYDMTYEQDRNQNLKEPQIPSHDIAT